jgi:hypothetical protein
VLLSVTLAVGVLGVCAGAVLALPRRDPGPTGAASSAATRGSDPSAASVPARPARRADSVLVPERPVRITLPSGTVVPVRPAATAADGRLAVPHDIRSAGWWEGGSRLGDPFGSMLVAAHVDSRTQGLGPYAELLQARPGQRVRVASRHLRTDFRVSSLRLVPQGPLSSQPWIFSAAGRTRLTMVTCAPPYDRSRGGYQNLAVVTAVPVRGPQPGPAR